MAKKKRPITRDNCGTNAGYTRHVYRGEYSCEPCRAARKEYARYDGAVQAYAHKRIREAHRAEYEALLKALDPRYGRRWARAVAILRDEYVKEYLEYAAEYRRDNPRHAHS